MMEKNIRIFIVDDHQLVIDGLTNLLSNIPAFEVVGHASDGKEFLEKFRENLADVVLMDIRMPNMDGLDTVEIAKKRYPNTKFLMLTMHTTRQYIKDATGKGADGYISKTKGQKDFIDGINRVLKGEFVIIVDLDQDNYEDLARTPEKPKEIEVLSDREKEVLGFIMEGSTTSEIADKVYRSTHTIERHRKNIMKKLKVKNVAEMVHLATKYNLHKDAK